LIDFLGFREISSTIAHMSTTRCFAFSKACASASRLGDGDTGLVEDGEAGSDAVTLGPALVGEIVGLVQPARATPTARHAKATRRGSISALMRRPFLAHQNPINGSHSDRVPHIHTKLLANYCGFDFSAQGRW
jgi:hypothetical protein